MHSVTSSYMVSHHHTYPVLYGKYTRAHVTSPYIVSHHHTHCHIIIHSQFCMVNILGYGKYTRGTDFHELLGQKTVRPSAQGLDRPRPGPHYHGFFFALFSFFFQTATASVAWHWPQETSEKKITFLFYHFWPQPAIGSLAATCNCNSTVGRKAQQRCNSKLQQQ